MRPIDHAEQEIPGQPATIVLELRLIRERPRAERLAGIVGLNELRGRDSPRRTARIASTVARHCCSSALTNVGRISHADTNGRRAPQKRAVVSGSLIGV